MVDDEGRSSSLHAPEAPDPAGPDDPDAGGATAVGRPERGPRLPWIVAGVAVVVAMVALVAAAVLVSGAQRPEADLAAVEQTAGEFALALTNWDASDGMGDTREQLRGYGTETFAADVDDLFGGTDDLATLAELGARSDGEVRDVLVQRLDGDAATALVVVVQRVTTEVTEGEEVSLRYAELQLVRDGDWRIDQVDLVVDALQETAQRSDATDLPGFGELDVDDDDATEDAP
jgi:nucleoid DNA-binding protein